MSAHLLPCPAVKRNTTWADLQVVAELVLILFIHVAYVARHQSLLAGFAQQHNHFKSRWLLKRHLKIPCRVQNMSRFSSKYSNSIVTAFPLSMVENPHLFSATREDRTMEVRTASARAPRCSTFSGSGERGRYAQGSQGQMARSDWNRLGVSASHSLG